MGCLFFIFTAQEKSECFLYITPDNFVIFMRPTLRLKKYLQWFRLLLKSSIELKLNSKALFFFRYDKMTMTNLESILKIFHNFGSTNGTILAAKACKKLLSKFYDLKELSSLIDKINVQFVSQFRFSRVLCLHAKSQSKSDSPCTKGQFLFENYSRETNSRLRGRLHLGCCLLS